MDHFQCDLCKGKGYIVTGPEDGMMTGRETCPGPYYRAKRRFNTENEFMSFTHNTMDLHRGLMIPDCIYCDGEM